jgi:integrase
MPRPRKGAHLWLRPEERKPDGTIRANSKWVIRDGRNWVSTGCGPDDRDEAEKRLGKYLIEKHEPPSRERPLSKIAVADVINTYLRDVAPKKANPQKVADSAVRLLEFFGRKTLDQITPELCEAYVAHRRRKGFTWKDSGGGARRDLEDFRAAINHHRKRRLHVGDIFIPLPVPGESRTRWLTRSEVARLLWACLTTRETQGGAATAKRPLRHLVRFILIGVYTGSRPGAILGLSWHQEIGRGWVDLERGMIYRMKEGAQANNKRQPPVPLAPELWRLMRRWAREDGERGPVVSFNGQPVQSVKTAIKRAVERAGLDTEVTAYTLRHTTGSWAVQKRIPTFKVAKLLGTSERMIEKHYGHLDPDHLRDEVAAIGKK